MRFCARYEDLVKLKREAELCDWDDGYASLIDRLPPKKFMTVKEFVGKDSAVAWLDKQVNAYKTAFGQGEIIEFESVPIGKRCDYCTCGGERRVHRYIVSGEGIDFDEAEDHCASRMD
jgi:hypothetical protein